MSPRRRDDPAWRAMFARLDAKQKADRIAEAERWRGLSDAEKWAEMADAARRGRRSLAGDHEHVVHCLVNRVVAALEEA